MRYTFKTLVNTDIQLAPEANALSTATLIRAKMDELSRYFPAGVEYSIPYDTSPFVKVSITKVMYTLVEAMVLVFAVMFLFLQNIRNIESVPAARHRGSIPGPWPGCQRSRT